MGPLEKYLKNFELEKKLKESKSPINPTLQKFLDECDRLNKILRDDTLFEKERKKYYK